MRLLVLGTGAAEAIPAVFCGCRVCQVARCEGGREVRFRTSYMLGDEIRIDWGVDAFAQTVRFGLDHTRLVHLLVTHSHEDHFMPEDILYRRKGFCQVPADSMLHIRGNEHVVARAEAMSPSPAELQVTAHLVRPFVPFEPEPGLRVTPIEGSHGPEDEHCLNYIIQVRNQAVLIGNDTGYYAEETWEALAEHALDAVLMDSTYGAQDHGSHHMGLPWVVKTRDRMAKLGVLSPGCRFIANHFSHNGGLTHVELVEHYTREGIEVAYDGMEIELGSEPAGRDCDLGR